MNTILHVLALLAVLSYVALIFVKERMSANHYLAADILMGIVLVGLIALGSRNILVLLSLLWLVVNYAVRLPPADCRWFAYDGFAAAAILSQLPLAKLL